jgi:hypothetical protein
MEMYMMHLVVNTECKCHSNTCKFCPQIVFEILLLLNMLCKKLVITPVLKNVFCPIFVMYGLYFY